MERYNRNILIKDFGEEGQARLKAAKVLVIGSGGLGSPVLLYLVAAGVGTLRIVDFDVVDESNLQRQILHFTEDVGTDKVLSASNKLHALNPEVEIITYNEKFTPDNAATLISSYDFIVDCCDNFATKFLIDDTCVQLQKPYSHGSVIAIQGEVMTYTPGNACYRDIFSGQPADESRVVSSQVGILGAMAGVVGSIQATEVIKYFTGIGDLLTNRLLIIDGRTMLFQCLKVNPLVP
ncbi:HesA/MoeB/ThiF family protein [Bacteroides sp. 51]|uniref:HesA/MoeB/ThiF family protein n=1 Tax=Bacteroides sp. 51 TaxID=2302938 RepID=UPI0013CF495C|nr:HesA/MoeB/ThiF family protein [Bacteroides sp. 51]NDV84031.1 HesA/MoeB/ThiF family protein [Bacteroides sp. 51]